MRKMLNALAGAILVTALVAPVPAQAAQQYNNIGFSVHRYGHWTYEIPYKVRNKTDAGEMWMRVGNNVDGGVRVRLIDVHTHRVIPSMVGGANGVGWSPSQTGHRKLLARGAPPGLRFAVQAKKDYPGGYDNYWSAWRPSGWFYY